MKLNEEFNKPKCDYLVKLYSVNERGARITEELEEKGIVLHPVRSADIGIVFEFIKKEFTFKPNWAYESLPALIHGNCIVAEKNGEVLGFICIHATAPGMMGPGGVKEGWRRMGIASAIFYHCVKRMLSQGYKYAVIGKPEDETISFSGKLVEIMKIPDSAGSYADRIKKKQ